MRRALIGRVAATTMVVLIALLLPMGSLIERFAEENALAVAGLEVQATESVVAFQDRADLFAFITDLNNSQGGNQTTVLFSDGDAIGPDKEITSAVRRARETNRAITNDTSAGVEVLVPVSLGRPPTADDPTADQNTAVIRVRVADSAFFSGVALGWLVLAGLGVALLALGVAVADRFARGLIGSVSGLAPPPGSWRAVISRHVRHRSDRPRSGPSRRH